MLKESHCQEQRLDITTRHLGEMVLSLQPGEARLQLDAGPWDLNPEPGPPTVPYCLCTPLHLWLVVRIREACVWHP